MGMHDTGSVRSKLILMAVATTIVALLTAAIAMIVVDARTFQRVWIDDLSTQADIVADVAAPAVSFNDSSAAARSLAVLRVRPQIMAAAIYTNSGQRFATYAKAGTEASFPARPEAAGHRMESGELEVFRPIVENGEPLGTVYLRSRFGLLDRKSVV